ncbi:protein-L-isoaspartate(D-aspartate) O-methyltransferase [Sphingomonas rubra]|uniref:Protein-L-isoaspartate O-methyltransferase n=2 Tax=Sphingomonas rubra TaxID=634430 RepID=A0A1I5RUA6_9SPHN|nr:protein-L-isoaspartate O-methyltransferase [Sphingomonas rubra]SFP62063.1 protein-L-isoaspartate(D-aspartate) O-methyltransferase [Sphingomonas rubra]
MTMLDQRLKPGMGADAMRAAMVSSQLRTTGVDDVRVVGAMATVAREDFVPPASRGVAYRDTAVPLGRGRYLNPPLATGRLVTEAQVLQRDRVLLIGAATGYTAAVLAMLGASVVAVEEDAGLLAIAREALDGVEGIELVEAPLTAGHPDGAPYDVLLVDGAVEALPDALLAQLRPGGRVATGLADRGVTRLASGRRTEGGSGLFAFADAECVVLPGFARPTGFRFG